MQSKNKITTGKNYPLGATLTNAGVNFAIFSKNATSIYLLLFDKPEDSTPTDIIPIENKTKFTFHCHIKGIKSGQLYGYKVDGHYSPKDGHRFNKNKLLIDPYAKALTGKFNWNKSYHLGYDKNSAFLDLSFSDEDNSAGVPKCIVVDDSFDWENDKHPDIPYQDIIIYETHIKGLTSHNSSGVKNKGTYLGVIEKIPYLLELGINAVEFLPVQECYAENSLLEKNLTNYWGYNTIGYFAPDSRFSSCKYPNCQVQEFKQMVKELHKAGIEIILDVVYNHTAEGNHLGPTLCFKGIDNAVYYNLYQPNKRYYIDYTGCGNSLNFDEPQVIKLVMDSLRYWVEVMHIDGFRFDLASVLGREKGKFDQISSFFIAVHQDPVISRVKLIAEPWDIAWDSYQVGNFPIDWAEWNGKYRDCVRRFIKSDAEQVPEVAYRLTGSSDLYGDDGRTPYNSINFITSHDGFTLYDLVSYKEKHNFANGEDNRDGANDNNSWNCGIEGETDNIEIINLRKKIAKNFITCLMISQGVPMILGGDEFLRTQKGNNNAYCQDNEINWHDWEFIKKNNEMFSFCKKIIAFRKKHPVLRKKTFFCGIDRNLDNIKDINWYDENLNTPSWENPELRCISFYLQGSEVLYETGIEDKDLFIILNSHWEKILFKLPSYSKGLKWYRVVDTGLCSPDDILEDGNEILLNPNNQYLAQERSVVILIGK